MNCALNSSKTPEIIANEIRMMNTTFKGVHFLVEGEDDGKFWGARVSKSTTSIVHCEGKTNLIGATGELIKSTFSNLSGIYDSDFDRILEVAHYPDVLATTDLNDLEATLISSAALDLIIHEYADQRLVEQFTKDRKISIADHIEATSREFGKLRFINHIMHHGVNFDRLSPYRFISQETWQINISGLMQEYTNIANISISYLENIIRTKCHHHEKWAYCQGHDSVKILAQGLKKSIGSRQLSEQDVARLLRIAFSDTHLRSTNMFTKLAEIEKLLPCRLFDKNN